MKYKLIALLVAFNPIVAFAQTRNIQNDRAATAPDSLKHYVQRNNVYADAGISFQNGAYPGLSITYNYALTKHFGIGAGFQGYKFSPTVTNTDQFTPAVYGDLRLKIHPRKKGFLFGFLDVGVDFYRHNNNKYYDGRYVYSITKNNGFYTGLGLGYLSQMTKRGGGLYASLKLIMNESRPDAYNTITKKKDNNEAYMDGTFVVSIGFKF